MTGALAPSESAADSPVVIVERDGPLLTVTLNRPQGRNAVNRQVSEAVAAAMSTLDADPQLLVGIVTGAGGNFFAGMDLMAFSRGERPSVTGAGFAGLTGRPPAKPLIAAVEGYALADGWEIALACDLVVASSSAVSGIPESRRGLVAAAGGLLRLPRRTSLQFAMELALTGEPIDVVRAYDLGLVNRLVEPGQALSQARSLAAMIAGNGPLATRAAKRILLESRDWPLGEAFARQASISEPVINSRDACEGARAFAERRQPAWQGQ